MIAATPHLPHTVDRSADADRVIQYLLAGDRRLVVMYGRRGSRRRELIREWIIPRLEGTHSVYYAECDPDLPATVSGGGPETPLEEALRAGALVFLGQTERYLAAPDGDRRRLAELLNRVERDELPGVLVVVIPERNLADMFAFKAVAPSLMVNMIEIGVVTFRESLRRLTAAVGAAGLEYTPKAIDILAEEVERSSGGDGVELARAVDQGFASFKSGADSTVTEEDCKTIAIRPGEGASPSAIAGALEEYRKGKMEFLAECWGDQASKTADAILVQIASPGGECGELGLNDVPLRLGITDDQFQRVLDWLRGEGQMLRADGNGQLEIVPSELRPVIQLRAARKQREVMRAWGMLRDGLRGWTQLGTVVPRQRLDEIEAVREMLPATDDEAALIVRSLLRVDDLDDPMRIRYWLRRIRSRLVEMSTLLEAVLAESPAVRLRAVRLLNGFDEPDVRHQLHRVATEDVDREVRLAALNSLAAMRVDELWPLVFQEACAVDSPYQANAVAALRLFADQRATALLSELVGNPDQRLAVRSEAILSMAALGTSESVKSLVNIGLNDDDAEDRSNAAAALGRFQSRERAREAVDAIRDSPVKGERAGPLTARGLGTLALRSVLSVMAGVANICLHGLALLVLRRYLVGCAFLAIELLVWLSRNNALWGDTEGWLILLAWNWLACQLIATRIAILNDKRRLDDRQRSGGESNVRRWELGVPFITTLLVLDLVPCLFVHGLAHALAGRIGRALRLFALECLGIACVAIAVLFFSGMFALITPFPPSISTPLWFLYAGVGILFIVGTFAWDVIPIMNTLVLRARMRHGWERRATLYEAVAGNAWAAEYLLECAAGDSGSHGQWARRIVKYFARVMPEAQLIASLKEQSIKEPSSRRPGYLVHTLQRIKTVVTVQALSQVWTGAGRKLRRWVVDILAGKPNEAALEQLRVLRQDLDWYGRLRAALAVWDYRLRLWPSMVILTSVLLVPLAVLASFEVSATMTNPARPALRTLQTPKVRSGMSDDQVAATLQFIAKAHPAASTDDLVDLFSRSAGESQAFRNAIAESLGTAACSLEERTTDEKENKGKKQHKLVWTLLEGLNRGRSDVIKGLAQIEHDPGRCDISDNSRKELARAASELLKKATRPEEVELAIAGLGAAGHRDSVEPLQTFATGLTGQKGPDQMRWFDLRLSALSTLDRNPSSEAAIALEKIGHDTDLASAGAPEKKMLADQAKKLTLERNKNLLAKLRVPLDRRDYSEAYDAATEFLKTGPSGELSQGVFDLMGQASYQLALSDETDAAGQWTNRAIEYLEKTKKTSYWTTDKPRMLSTAYALRAQRLMNQGHAPAAFSDAKHVLVEDPTSPLGNNVQAWLLQQQNKYEASLPDIRTAIGKDPSVAWSYDLLQNVYKERLKSLQLRQQTLQEVTEQFEQLANKYPNVMWPRRRLVNIYHDWVATPEGLQKSYELYTELDKQFGDQLTERDKLDFDSNYLEARFTVGRLQEVANLGSALDKRLASNDYELRIPVNVLSYAALVMLDRTAEAEAELIAIERLIGQLPDGYQLTWDYSGTIAYLKAQSPLNDMQNRMIRLIEEVNKIQTTRRLPADIIAANRAALRAAAARGKR